MIANEHDAVTVARLPERLGAAQWRTFFRDTLVPYVDIERPRLVLDCSDLREIDDPAIYVILGCLEEAMKRNGDVKLASVSPQGESVLERARVADLFEIYETAAQAVESFRPVFDRPDLIAEQREAV